MTVTFNKMSCNMSLLVWSKDSVYIFYVQRGCFLICCYVVVGHISFSTSLTRLTGRVAEHDGKDGDKVAVMASNAHSNNNFYICSLNVKESKILAKVSQKDSFSLVDLLVVLSKATSKILALES